MQNRPKFGLIRWLASFLLVFASISIASAAKKDDPLFPIVKNHKWGYMNKAGMVVIAPQFTSADYFSEGLAPVKIGYGIEAKFGFINRSGKMVIQPKYADAKPFSDGRAAVAIGQKYEVKWGFIDQRGQYIVRPQYDGVDDFDHGTAVAYTCDENPDSVATRRFIINKEGKVIYKGPWTSDDLFYTVKNGKIDISAEELKWTKFSNGLAPVPFEGKNGLTSYGYIDKTGKVIIKPQFADAKQFSDGFAAISVEVKERGHNRNKWGYVDKTGKMVIQPQFADNPGDFTEGLALVSIEIPESKQRQLIAEGIDDSNKRYGFIDKKGKFVIEPKFEQAEGFKYGLARVWVVEDDLGGEPSYIDKTGKFIWKSEQ